MSHRRRPRRPRPGNPRSGVALLLSVLVLIVVISIVFQIQIATMTGARVTRNDVGLTSMDLAAESAAREILELLKADAEASAAGGEAPGAAPGAGEVPGAGGQGEQPPPADSREDEWARPQRPEINRIQMRVLVQDEDSKYNVLNLMDPDEDRARAARERVRRILDLCREGTREDIGSAEAEDMVRVMVEYLTERDRFQRARPVLLTDDEEEPNRALPLSLREFATLEPFEPRHFRDYRDEDGERVLSIGTFLTIWTTPATASQLGESGSSAQPPGAAPTPPAGQSGEEGQGGEAPGQGQGEGQGQGQTGQGQAPGGAAGGSGAGYGVNVNTAPPPVLKGLFDRRDVSDRFWDDVIEYRNTEEEPDDQAEDDYDQEPIYDEYGREVVPHQFFDTLEELSELEAWEDYDPPTQESIRSLLGTQSQVFSIFITARRSTAANEESLEGLFGEERVREEETAGTALVRTVRMVVWRREGADGPEVVPIVPWEVLDYTPYEVLDYPEDDPFYRR